MNIFDYIMGIDGNMTIKSDGVFDALGDMWIGGTAEEEYLYKYLNQLHILDKKIVGSIFLYK